MILLLPAQRGSDRQCVLAPRCASYQRRSSAVGRLCTLLKRSRGSHATLGIMLRKVMPTRTRLSLHRSLALAWAMSWASLTGGSAAYAQDSNLHSDEAAAQYHKGLALMQAGKLEDAQAALEEAIKLRPGYAAAELTLGNTLRKPKKCDKAVPLYESVIRTQPDDPFAHGNLGYCY